jgi:error-prone DNA polymerase
LVERAAALGYKALALTDECSLAGVVRAHMAAKRVGLHFIVGSQFRLVQEDGSPAFSLIVLAQNKNGYGNLSELITWARTRAKKGQYVLHPQDLALPTEAYAHLQGLPDCFVILAPEHGIDEDKLAEQVTQLQQIFPHRLWIALTLLHQAGDEQHRATIEHVSNAYAIPIMATGDVCMHVRSRKPLQDVLTAVRVGKPVAECGYALTPNAEQHLRARLRLANIYPPATLEQTIHIAKQCTFSLDELRYEYPDEFVPIGETPASYLRRETYTGAHERYPSGIPAKVQKQIEHELELISDMRYESYCT